MGTEKGPIVAFKASWPARPSWQACGKGRVELQTSIHRDAKWIEVRTAVVGEKSRRATAITLEGENAARFAADVREVFPDQEMLTVLELQWWWRNVAFVTDPKLVVVMRKYGYDGPTDRSAMEKWMDERADAVLAKHGRIPR